MAIQIKDSVIQSEAAIGVKDNLLAAVKATRGAITVGRNIHKGDFEDTLMFDDFGNIVRRDPNVDTAVSPDRLVNIEDVAVKLYFKGDLFITNTELERYGSSVKNMNKTIGTKIGEKISRWALEKGLIACVGALTSQADLIAGDGSTDIDTLTLNDAAFKLGDMSGDVITFVAPSLATHKLIGNAISSASDQIAYGAVYASQIGTLGRSLWTVDNAALNWDDAGTLKNYTLGLTQGAISIDESEIVKILSALDITQENSGYRFKAEGAYTVKVKGFAYNAAQGSNPTDAVLGANASWTLIKDVKHGAGVVAKTL